MQAHAVMARAQHGAEQEPSPATGLAAPEDDHEPEAEPEPSEPSEPQP